MPMSTNSTVINMRKLRWLCRKSTPNQLGRGIVRVPVENRLMVKSTPSTSTSMGAVWRNTMTSITTAKANVASPRYRPRSRSAGRAMSDPTAAQTNTANTTAINDIDVWVALPLGPTSNCQATMAAIPAKLKAARLISPAYPVVSTSEMAMSDRAMPFAKVITAEFCMIAWSIPTTSTMMAPHMTDCRIDGTRKCSRVRVTTVPRSRSWGRSRRTANRSSAGRALPRVLKAIQRVPAFEIQAQ